ncbi:MAG: hypothetical protein AAFR20_03605 [Pseudomonadota bacterium]
MAFDRPDWRNRLSLGADDVLASFYTIVPAAAFVVIGALIEPRLISSIANDPDIVSRMESYGMAVLEPAPIIPRILIAMLLFGIAWSLTLGILIRIARRLEGDAAMGTMIIGYNWLQFYMRALAVLPFIVFWVSASPEIMSVVVLPCLALSMVLLWGMLRRALPRTEWTVIVGIIICMGIVYLIAGFLASMIGLLFYTPAPLRV